MAKTNGLRLGKFRFTMKDTGESSRRFGPCEVCNRSVSEVYLQGVSREYALGASTGRLHLGDLFGHRRCLASVRGNVPALKSALALAGERSEAA